MAPIMAFVGISALSELVVAVSDVVTDVADHASAATAAADTPASPLAPVVAHGPWGLAIWALVSVYILLVAILALYGMHRGMLVGPCWRKWRKLRGIEHEVSLTDGGLP